MPYSLDVNKLKGKKVEFRYDAIKIAKSLYKIKRRELLEFTEEEVTTIIEGMFNKKLKNDPINTKVIQKCIKVYKQSVKDYIAKYFERTITSWIEKRNGYLPFDYKAEDGCLIITGDADKFYEVYHVAEMLHKDLSEAKSYIHAQMWPKIRVQILGFIPEFDERKKEVVKEVLDGKYDTRKTSYNKKVLKFSKKK